MTAWSYRYRKVFLKRFKGMKYHPGRMVVGIDERLKDLAKAGRRFAILVHPSEVGGNSIFPAGENVLIGLIAHGFNGVIDGRHLWASAQQPS